MNVDFGCKYTSSYRISNDWNEYELSYYLSSWPPPPFFQPFAMVNEITEAVFLHFSDFDKDSKSFSRVVRTSTSALPVLRDAKRSLVVTTAVRARPKDTIEL